MQRYSVLLIEDDANTRNKLAQAVTANEHLNLLAAVECCEAARQQIAKEIPDILLTDLDLPDGNGLDIIKELHEKSPDTEIMVITVFGDEKHVLSAVEAGATGYLLKDTDSERIGDAILELVDGKSPISPSIARHLLKRFQPETSQETKEVPVLTEREIEVLNYAAKGFSYAEIADMTGISVHTVTSHIKHIYKKLSVRSRGEAVFEAMQLGIIKLNE